MAVALIVWLAQRAGLNGAAIWSVLGNLGPFTGLLIICSIAIPVGLAAEKWRKVLICVGNPADIYRLGRVFFHYHTSLATLLGQVLSPFLTGPLVRGMAARRLSSVGFAKGALSSGLEQGFDAAVTLILTVAAFAAFGLGLSIPWSLVFMAGAGLAGFAVLYTLARSNALLSGVIAALGKSPARRIGELLDTSRRLGLMQWALWRFLFLASFVRFWANALRAIAIAIAMGAGDQLPMILFAFALVQVVQFAPLTPGGLGLAEWGWAFALTSQGWTLEAAATFALATRAVGIAATVLVFAATLVWKIVSTDRDKSART